MIFAGNQTIVIYLHRMVLFHWVPLNLTDGTYRPYQKPDSIIQYIHVTSNHPPNIIKQIPKKTPEKRLSQLSTKKQIFNESAPFYENKLQQSGHQQKLGYNPLNAKIHNKHNHKRNMIWFNPHFSKNVSTKLGKYFLNLLHSHFLQNHCFRKFS